MKNPKVSTSEPATSTPHVMPRPVSQPLPLRGGGCGAAYPDG